MRKLRVAPSKVKPRVLRSHDEIVLWRRGTFWYWKVGNYKGLPRLTTGAAYRAALDFLKRNHGVTR